MTESDARLFRFAAVCSALSAITTLLLIFLPALWDATPGFEARMARVHDPAYRLRSWVYLLHPFVTFAAALGIAAALRRRAPLLALAGILGFGLWALVEASQQTLTLFAFDKWRVAWATANDATRATIRVNTAMYDGIWDGLYALLLVGFAIGNACLAAALVREHVLGRVVGGFMLAACVLTLALLAREIGLPMLPDAVLDWSYPAIQPLGRLLIGVWLWRQCAGRATG